MEVQLSVSSRSMGTCGGVVSALAAAGISASVTATANVVRGAEEPGCRILLPEGKASAAGAWEVVRAVHPDVVCAHVRAPGFSGCVVDYFSPSQCPGSKII